jgi:hypothetical protein
MKAAGIINKEAATDRILKAGFQAVAEYDEFGNLVDWRGGSLSRQDMWPRVGQIAFSRGGAAAEEKATAMILGDMIVVALNLEGGGTLLAIVEGQFADAAADELTHALDAAVGDYIGPIPAPLAVLGGVLILALILLGTGGLE